MVSIGTALLISAVIGAGSAAYSVEQQKKGVKAADIRAKEQLAAQKALASQVTAPTVGKEGEVELLSSEALEEEEILGRAKRGRLRVARKAAVKKGTTVKRSSTGLRVG